MKGSTAAHAGLGGIPPVSVPVFTAVVSVAIVFLLYCVLTSNKVFSHLRRFGISCLTAMVVAAAGVGYVDHTHHARLVAKSATGTGSSVMGALLSAWGFGTIVLTILFFLVATWFTRRRAARFGGGLRFRGGGQEFSPVPRQTVRWPE